MACTPFTIAGRIPAHTLARLELSKMAEALVLVVDDDPLTAGLLAHVVKDCGLRAEVAYDGQQALGSIRAHKPDLVLLDLLLPVMNGSRVLATLEADPDLRDVPVIVISTWDEAIEGVDREVPHVCKPFELTEVKRLVLETLGNDH
jgi:CheY-like chemotaxis protein